MYRLNKVVVVHKQNALDLLNKTKRFNINTKVHHHRYNQEKVCVRISLKSYTDLKKITKLPKHNIHDYQDSKHLIGDKLCPTPTGIL